MVANLSGDFRSESSSHEIVKANLGLAHYFARKYATYYAEYEDLVQEGSLALMLAALKWDRERKFSYYASPCVRGAILHYIRDKALSVRQKRGEALKVLSLNTPVYSDNGQIELLDLLTAPEEPENVSYQHVLEKLSVKQRFIFDSYFLKRHSARDIAKLKRVPINVILRQLKAIRAKFKTYL
jgi:RNA polymerase sigma factor (sigma-70 family)